MVKLTTQPKFFESEDHVRICILMATFNGEDFIAEQLDSIEQQTYKNWCLIISDDSSSDNTLAIAKQYQERWGFDRLEIRQGPSQGYCQNFLSMACDSNIHGELYAFSDQDDVWMEDKLSKAVAYFHANNDAQTPRVYCGRTEIVDDKLNTIGLSPKFTLPTSFRNALVQSIAGGNTMVFNKSAKELLEKAGKLQVVSHDWWLYQIVKGAGGIFYYDPMPSLLYRQHSTSVVGSNCSLRSRTRRILYLLSGRFKEWNTTNFEALMSVRHLLSTENQDILDTFGKFRCAKLKDRIRLLEVCGLYRQTWQGTFSLWLATIIKKI
jgi:glycosyltransferase involved in cell wall biosynthesis